jgi:hypothetical protein
MCVPGENDSVGKTLVESVLVHRDGIRQIRLDE